MGGTCTKMLASSNQPVTSKILIQKQMVPVLPSDTKLEGDVSNVKKGHELNKDALPFEEQDALSKGDYTREEMHDKQSGTNEVPMTQEQHNSTPQVSPQRRDNEEEIDSNTSNGIPLAPNEQWNESVVGENSSDGNNSQHKTKIKEIQKPCPGESSGGDATEKDKENLPADSGQVKDNEGKHNGGDDGGKTEASEQEAILRSHLDRLYFLQLSENGGRCPTPSKLVVERLQNKPRKPALMTYDERMMLADLNRFEQLDKRREFAVSRNRSVTRNGRLSKIPDLREVSPENSCNSLNAPLD